MSSTDINAVLSKLTLEEKVANPPIPERERLFSLTLSPDLSFGRCQLLGDRLDPGEGRPCCQGLQMSCHPAKTT